MMSVSALVIAIMHVGVRYVSAEIHPFEIAFVRNLTGFLLLAPVLMSQGRDAFRTTRPGLHAVRGVIGNAAMLSWFYSLSILPVGDATALSFTAVIFTALGAIVILKERVGVRRWAAIIAGFVGTLVILRPGLQAVSTGALLALGSTVLWSASLICVKIASRTDSSVTIVFYSMVYFTVFSSVPAMTVWQWPSPEQWGMLAAIGVLATIGHLTLAEAMKEVEASAIMPLDYSRMIWAAGLGYLVFGEFPDLWTWVGGTVIFASTVYIAYREARTQRAAVAEAALKAREDY